MSDIVIIKKPLDDSERILPSKNFPHMPILYLEFLENKTKVKKEYINKNYIPCSLKKHTSKTKNDVEYSATGAINDSSGDPSPNDNLIREIPAVNSDTSIVISDVFDDIENNSNFDENLKNQNVPDASNPSDHDKIIEEQLISLLGEDPSIPEEKSPPTLEELQQQKKIGPRATISRDYRYVEEEDEETQKERNAVYFKYEVLRRMHPNSHIPEFTIYSDPKLMSQKYELLTKKLSLETSVDSWKRYMIIFVMGCEVVLGKLSFDMEGFAQQQIMSMNTYDQLLVEMAEKSYIPSGSSKWPPEARLLMMLTMNVVLFVISKMIFKKTGTNLLGTINDLTSPQERKMKEPSNE